MRASACILLSLLSAACVASPPDDKRDPLPFHVAIAPLSEDHVSNNLKAGNDGSRTDMSLEIEKRWREEFTRGLVRNLQQDAFARVSLLHADSADATQAEDARERDSRLISEAHESGADLLMCLDFSFRPGIRGEVNGTFYVNLPLFALGGPFVWFLPDRTYFVEAEVSARFYDTRMLEAPLNPTGAVANARRQTERMDLNFLSRAPGVGHYLLSMVWPAGWVATDTDELQRELLDRIVEQLGKGLALSVLDQRTSFQRGTAPFYLDLDVAQSKLTRDAEGKLVLRGSACLTPTREIESMGTWRVLVEDQVVLTGSFDDGPRPKQDGAFLRYSFEARPTISPETTSVRLEIEAGERSPRVRSYTFRVPPATAPDR